MKTCCVCRNTITSDEPAYLFIGQAGDEKQICSTCEKNYDVFMESENPEELKQAINYLYTCVLSANDNEVASFLKEAIDRNSSIVSEMEYEQTKSDPVNMAAKRDYFSDRQSELENAQGGSFWISGMRFLSWIFFVAILIVGIAFAVQVGDYSARMGFLIFIVSVITAFLSVAIIMIFLDMARDLSEIKEILKKRRN